MLLSLGINMTWRQSLDTQPNPNTVVWFVSAALLTYIHAHVHTVIKHNHSRAHMYCMYSTSFALKPHSFHIHKKTTLTSSVLPFGTRLCVKCHCVTMKGHNAVWRQREWCFVPQTRLRCKTTLVWLCYHCGLPHYKHTSCCTRWCENGIDLQIRSTLAPSSQQDKKVSMEIAGC